MIITVTSPRKRMGQTITSINLCALAAKMIEGQAVLIDMNMVCRDIEYYLSDACLTKGLDDFCSLYYAGLLDMQTFKTCVKKVHRSIDIMTANECFKIENKEAEALLDFVSRVYDMAVIDASNNSCKEKIFEKSDWILIVINQAKNIVKYIKNHSYYKYREKIVFIINKYSERMEGIKINYGMDEIRADLRKLGYGSPVFALEFDTGLVNECNDQSLLNYIFNSQNKKYIRQMDALSRFLLKPDEQEKSCECTEVCQGKGILRMLPLFGHVGK